MVRLENSLAQGEPLIRVAIVITRLDLGGAQEVALETAARLDPQRFDARLLAGPGGFLDGKAKQRLGARFVTLPSLLHPIAPLKDLQALFELWIYFRREKIQVVHTHSSKAGLLGRMAAWLARVPRVVHTVHGWSFNDEQAGPSFFLYQGLERLLAHFTDVLAVVAQSCRDKGLLNGVGKPHQYALLRAAVDLQLWARAPRNKRALMAVLRKTPKPLKQAPRFVVGCIANCKPQKNPLDFVRVAARVLTEVPQACFVYVGDGPLKADAQALAAKLGIAPRVRFVGWQKDPQALAAGFDAFLLCSLYEGLPCVFPQVLIQGTPVVATGVDGAAEIVREGVNGYLCQPRDVEALASRVTALLTDKTLRQNLGAAARLSVGEEFTVDAMVSRSALLYRL
jgi:glycosyltransferase involved in cell wall biosynthesis